MAVFTSEEIIQATGARLLKRRLLFLSARSARIRGPLPKVRCSLAFKGTSFNGHDFVGKALEAALPLRRIGSTPGI